MAELLESRVLLSSINVLASFKESTMGSASYGVILSGGTLYGTAVYAGTAISDGYPFGDVFSLPVAGGTPTVLASFNGDDGANAADPNAGLILAGSTLYGTAGEDNTTGGGEVFSLPVAGGIPTVLASAYADFPAPIGAGGPGNGVIVSGSTLYGTTSVGGGDFGEGEVYSLPTAGGTPNVLASLTSEAGGGLTLSGSTLYGTLSGTTLNDSSNSDGAIFSLPIGGGTPTVLASFDGADGATPGGTLVVSGSTLYGTTSAGGEYGDGEIFSLPVAGGTPNVLASFDDTTGPPSAGVILSGSTLDLYGTTTAGGDYGDGEVFFLPVAGGTPTVVASFDDTTSGGVSMIRSGSTLYGTAADTVFDVSLGLSGAFTGSIPTTAKTGQTISPALQITDAPDAAPVVSGDETTDYYLSTTPDLSGIITPALATNDYTLNLDAGASFAESQDVTIPADIATGTYYLVAQIDANQTINSSDTDDFVASGKIEIGAPALTGSIEEPITFTQTGDSLPADDSGDQMVPLGSEEATLHVVTDITNNGAATGDASIEVDYYLSPTQTLDTSNANTYSLDSDTVSLNLDHQASTNVAADLDIPQDENIQSNKYYILAVIDPQNALDESNTTEDRTASSNQIDLRPRPVLVVPGIGGRSQQ